MAFNVTEMSIKDFEDVQSLWKSSEAIVLRKVDSRESIQRLLNQNPGLSFVARENGACVGAVLCTQDGRMGYLTHLVVRADRRRLGIGRQLVGRCMFALTGQGIHECMLLLMQETEEALRFWDKVDPAGRVKLVMMAPR